MQFPHGLFDFRTIPSVPSTTLHREYFPACSAVRVLRFVLHHMKLVQLSGCHNFRLRRIEWGWGGWMFEDLTHFPISPASFRG